MKEERFAKYVEACTELVAAKKKASSALMLWRSGLIGMLVATIGANAQWMRYLIAACGFACLVVGAVDHVRAHREVVAARAKVRGARRALAMPMETMEAMDRIDLGAGE